MPDPTLTRSEPAPALARPEPPPTATKARRAGTLPFDTTDPLLARAAWSALAEPADEAAGALVADLGPIGALDVLLAWERGRTAGGPLDPRARAALLARCAPRLDVLDPRRDLDTLARHGGHTVVPTDARWPAALDDLGPRAPHLLWVRGSLPPTLHSLRGERGPAPIALVGSRTATAYGQRVAADIAHALAERGHAVVSGGAFGIDIAAHRAAIAADGTTVAVLAGGLAAPYPRAHADWFERIAATGALVAELAPHAEPRRHRFLTRNRLIAAMSAGTLVVEAGLRSGALNTARTALDLARPVGAVPGPVTSAMSAGCHELLRCGAATLVTDAADARELVTGLTALADDPVEERRAPEGVGLLDGLAPHAAVVLDAMPVRAARFVREIAVAAGLGDDQVRSALAVLELGGRVEREGERWRRSRRLRP